MTAKEIEKQAFLKYCNKERNKFVNFINHEMEWNRKLRTKSESLIISFDQLVSRYEKSQLPE